MTEYSHRDRRAQREVGRAFFAIVGVIGALIVLALVVPLWFAGPAAVVALGGVGVAYLGWSDAFLENYSNDLRTELEVDRSHGFLRAEMRSPVGLDRAVGGPTARSPHVRRRTPGASRGDGDPLAVAGSDPDQL